MDKLNEEYDQQDSGQGQLQASAGKPAIEGWLLIYVEFTIVVIVLRLLGAYFVMTGEIGWHSRETEYAVYMGSALIQSLLAMAVLLVIVLRLRSAPRLAIASEFVAIAAIAANLLAFGAAGENWVLTAGQLILSGCWIVYFLRSARVRRIFARSSEAAPQ